MFKSYLYRCSRCQYEQNFSSEYVNERCYCHKCETDGKAVLMDQVKENKHIDVKLLTEDDHK